MLVRARDTSSGVLRTLEDTPVLPSVLTLLPILLLILILAFAFAFAFVLVEVEIVAEEKVEGIVTEDERDPLT